MKPNNPDQLVLDCGGLIIERDGYSAYYWDFGDGLFKWYEREPLEFVVKAIEHE